MGIEKEVFHQAGVSGFKTADTFRKVTFRESMEYLEGAVSHYSSENERLCVRVFRDTGQPYGFSLFAPDINGIRDSFRLLGGAFINSGNVNFKSQLPSSTEGVPVEIYDSNWGGGFKAVCSELVNRIREQAAGFEGMKVRSIKCEGREEKRYISNTKGLESKYRKTIFSLSLMTEMDGGVVETKEDRVFLDLLDPVKLVSRSFNLISSLKGEPDIDKRDHFFIFTPEAASSILREFAGEFIGTYQAKGTKINFPSVITLMDNSTVHGLCGSAPFDDEGVGSKETVLIDKGFPLNRIYDLRRGYECGKSSSGNGYRPERGVFPAPRFTNLYLKPSVLSQGMLMKKAGSGIFISLIRPKYREGKSMTFSVCGFRFEGGEVTTPVRFYLKTSINSFFLNTLLVSREIRFFNNGYNTGSPYLLTEGRVNEGVAEI